MQINRCDMTLHEMQRLTVLARATDDVVLRAEYYRLAERCRLDMKDVPKDADG